MSSLDSASSKAQAAAAPVAGLGRENIPLILAGLFVSAQGGFLMACCNDVRLNCTQGQSCSWIARLFGFYDRNALPIMPKDCLRCRERIHLHLFRVLSKAFLKRSHD